MAQSKIFGPVRCRWVAIDAPRDYKNNGKFKYSLTVLIPKTDKAAIKQWEDYILSAVNANGNWKDAIKKQVFASSKKTIIDTGRNNLCVLCDGDLLNEQALAEDETVYPEYKGMIVVKLSRPASFGAPLVCRQDKTEIPPAMIPGEIRPGDFVNVEISPYVYMKPNNGISLQLQAVQLKKAAPFPRQNNFDEIEVEETEESEGGSFDE